MSLRIRTAVALAACVVSGAFLACVSDSATTSSGGVRLDGGTASDAEVVDGGSTSDAPSDASTCSVPTDNGVGCFPERCPALFKACCVSLGGGNTLTGGCVDKGDAALATCQSVNAALWECDRPKDCPSSGARCCIPNLFKLEDDKVCPIKLALNDDPDAGGGPKDGKATRCTQSGCDTNEIGACELDKDCSPSDRCVPAVLQGKVFGICRKR